MENFMTGFTAIVLAAGKGKRMKAVYPKVLHNLAGKPMIYHVLRVLFSLKKHVKQVIVVVGHESEEVERAVKKLFDGVEFVYQKERLGTAHAVRTAQSKVRCKDVIVLCGDAPLIRKKTISSFISRYLKEKKEVSLITADMDYKNDLGRIVRDSERNIKAIRENIEVGENGNLREVNSGIYCFSRDTLFGNLDKIKINLRKNEYFLTDIIEILYHQGLRFRGYLLNDDQEILGINSPKDLYLAEKVMRKRNVENLFEKGVKIYDCETTFIEDGVKIGKNTIIYPFTFIEKDVIIGKNCLLGPFVRIRQGTIIRDNTQLGNFVEVNRVSLGRKVTMKHFGYLGDVRVEDGVNIGAGVVVANYDGKKKHKSVIKQGAFIGSDTILVAPVEIGKQAVTGAGSVVTRNVRPRTVVTGVPAKFFKRKTSF